MGLGVTDDQSRWWRRRCQVLRLKPGNWHHSAAVADVDPAAVTFGEVDASWADGFTEMIVSPGVPLDHPLVVEPVSKVAGSAGTLICSSRRQKLPWWE